MNTFFRNACGDRHLAGCHRFLPRLLFSVVMLLASLAGIQQPAAAEMPAAMFHIAETVNVEDAETVIESIRLARDLLAESVDPALSRQPHVTVFAESSTVNPMIVGMSMGESIIVYTGSDGWRWSTAAERTRVILHEYTHFYQHQVAGFTRNGSPAWFEEGLAEYLSVVLLDDLDLLDRPHLEAAWHGQLSVIALPQTLSMLESHEGFRTTGQFGYQLAYFGVALLFHETGLSGIERYYELLASGFPSEMALAAVFGLTLDEFYPRFELWWETLSSADDWSSVAFNSEGEAHVSPVRIEAVPEVVVPDDQLLIKGRALPFSICSLTLQIPGEPATSLHRSTIAAADGDVFWLITIPVVTPPGPAVLTGECGGPAVSIELTIAAGQVPGSPAPDAGMQAIATRRFDLQRFMPEQISS